MKTLKLEKRDTKIERKHISKFGEMVYRCPGVKRISIKVNFEDGSMVGFCRSECVDTIEEALREDE